MRNLVIVESGVKGKTIAKYLNIPEINSKYGKFKVIASNGHIRDLVKKKEGTENGIDVTNWNAYYETIKTKAKTIRALKEAIDESDMVWLAADLDREGEGIAWHIKQFFKLKKYKRITFNEITQNAIIRAINNPRDIDYNLVDAQQGRRILDRIIGFRLTQTLWKNFDTYSTMSAGRVQSVLLMILCENEKKINAFESSSYWNIHGNFQLDNIKIEEAKLYDDAVLKKYDDKKLLVKFFDKLRKAQYIIDKNNTKIKQKNEKAPLPFITSTMQQDAHSKLGFSSKKTMKVAQELYEAGHITYMRTDSTSLSNDAMKMIHKYIVDTYGEKLFFNNNATNTKKTKNAQEAHEAIRPTKMKELQLTGDQKKLYDFILKRTIASQMKPAVYEELHIHLKHDVDKTVFVGKAKALIEQGYLVVYDVKREKSLESMLKEIQVSNKTIKPIKIIGHNVWTSPPQHFNESKVIKTLESVGIGRPSTYASILDKLFERQFIQTQDIVGEDKNYEDYIIDFKTDKLKSVKETRSYFNEKNKIVPTANGCAINDFLYKNFSNIVNIDFTSLMEDDLDEISNGRKNLKQVMSKFYQPFVKECEKLKVERGKKTKIEGTNNEFNIKGKTYIVRNARYGPVIQQDKTFISLTQFLKDTDKSIEDINEKDIKLLTSLPKKVDSNKTLMYGRYGFYFTFEKEDKTLRVYKNMVKDVLEGNYEKFVLKK